MKCPKCHKEVKKGSLYCPNCLTEIPWVQEFNSVETLMEKKKREEPSKGSLHLRTKWHRRSRRLRLFWIRRRREVVILCAVFAAILGGFFYHQLHTFPVLYERASKEFQNGDYERAMKYTQEALEQRGNDLSANLLLAQIQQAEGETDSAILVLRSLFQEYPDSVQLYQLMLELLYSKEELLEIRALMESCTSPKVREACSDYICEEPVSSLPPGTYTSAQEVALSAEYEDIYYTLDGSIPDSNSQKYTKPLALTEGVTTLHAIGYNKKGIPSEIIGRKYVIVESAPNPPEILPESGSYTEATSIELTVPDGCRAYYAFDKEPDVNSTEYTTPIGMPQGYHVFYAILVAANGKISETASRTYYLEY